MSRNAPITTLSVETFTAALSALAADDPALAAWLQRYGPPTPWWRPAGYSTLARLIVEQQVSLASARAVCRRLEQLGALTDPARLLHHPDAVLRAAGLSRQKLAYLRALATALVQGELDLEELESLADNEVRQRLVALKGIGPWTAEVYLLMALRRPDAWPASDLGLLVALKNLYRLPARPTAHQAQELAERWRPHRSAVSWLLWHGYLVELGLPRP